MKKKIMFIGSLICNVLLLMCVIIVVNEDKEVLSSNTGIKKSNNSGALSMLFETESGSGNYEEVGDVSWPLEGYTFNATRSKCENGSELSWDDETNQVVMMGNVSDKCYVYFDISNTPKAVFLADYVKSLYTGVQGENYIYYHKNLANSAEDGSYRYAGSYESVENYVCFGDDDTNGNCLYDKLYRIIGVFGDQIKLIKADYAKSSELGTDGDYDKTYAEYDSYNTQGTNKGSNTTEEIGTYHWNYSNTSSSKNIWAQSRLNTLNLNQTYLNSLGPTWQSKIATMAWVVGGNTGDKIEVPKAATTYQNEILNPQPGDYGQGITTEPNKKIGLMYVSDYGFAAEPSAWQSSLSNYSKNNIPAKNWMYGGLDEWTISRHSGKDYLAFNVSFNGHVNNFIVSNNGMAIRPVFYLESTVTKIGGTGTSNDPYRIS